MPEGRIREFRIGNPRAHGLRESFDTDDRVAVIEINPDSPRARYGLGLAKLYLDDNAGALAEYLALKPLDPELARDLYLRIPVEN